MILATRFALTPSRKSTCPFRMPSWAGSLLVQGGTIAVLVLGLTGLVPNGGWAQSSDSVQVAAEGRVLNHSTKTLYFYRVTADSTVYIRQGRPPADSSIVIPATSLGSIHETAEEQLFSSEQREFVAYGYEGNDLYLQFTQRFNFYVFVALIVVVVVGGSLLAWLWWRLVRERRRRKAVARSRRYVAEGREKERKRLAQEIHDGPVQELHGLHMQLKASPDSPDSDRFQAVGEELVRVTSELRAMSADLHPPALQRFGLPAALRSHADRLSDRHADLHIDTELDEKCGSLPDEFALALFRIAQEAMNNAAQHGQARHLDIQFHCEDRTVELEIRDDGTGFELPEDWHTLADEDHYGLLGMQERAEVIGADLDVDSAPGKGTRVRVRGTAAPLVTGDPP